MRWIGIILCILLSWGGLAATTQDEYLLVVQTFQNVAYYDPWAAGEIWMSPQAQTQWEAILRDNPQIQTIFEVAIWFVDDQASKGGLYNPWIGSLVILGMNSQACLIEAVHLYTLPAIPPTPDPVAWGDGFLTQFAMAAQVFAGQIPQESTTITSRVQEIRSRLAGYPQVPAVRDLGDPDWEKSLSLQWVIPHTPEPILIYASPLFPLEFMWVEGGQEAVTQILRITLGEV